MFEKNSTHIFVLIFSDKLTSRRRSKQFLIPLVWPYSVQVVPASDRSNGGGDHSHFVTFLPLQYYHLYYPSVTPANQSPTNRKFIDSFAGNYISSHASINKLNRDDEVACKIHGTVLGSCKSFTECFPMMEVEYGIDGSFMDSPLVEQLILTTNATVCSQSTEYFLYQNARFKLNVDFPAQLWK